MASNIDPKLATAIRTAARCGVAPAQIAADVHLKTSASLADAGIAQKQAQRAEKLAAIRHAKKGTHDEDLTLEAIRHGTAAKTGRSARSVRRARPFFLGIRAAFILP